MPISPLIRFYDYSGRSSRLEYWSFIVLSIPAVLVVGALDLQGRIAGAGWMALAWLVVLLPLTVRRLRDAGFSQAWMLLSPAGVVTLLMSLFLAQINLGVYSDSLLLALILCGMSPWAFLAWLLTCPTRRGKATVARTTRRAMARFRALPAFYSPKPGSGLLPRRRRRSSRAAPWGRGVNPPRA